ncbi:MAG TPA: S41 family peptidase [Candidatus Angelobacter sp.]|nr:S41 family peptidase [Candidatus Angelobacter sp.]
MTRSRKTLLLAALLALAGQVTSWAQTNNPAPDFQEVYDLIRQHVSGLSTDQLDRAAVQGLVSALGPRVALETNNALENADEERAIIRTNVFDGGIVYLRIEHVDDKLPQAIRAAYQEMAATNKASGVVLDLRYAGGFDYKAATDTADLFVSKNEPLLNWGDGVVFSHEKSSAIAVPVAVLVNHETSGAAEALAAIVRETGSGLILGSRTAGAAMVMQDYPLKDGEHLRIASTPVTLGDGAAMSADGVKPDIKVPVSGATERAFYADSFLVITNAGAGKTNAAAGTNELVPRVLLNEAELVREHKAGENPDEQVARRPPQPQAPVVSDPALARALDLLKGLAVVRENKF